jgi:hypothetical protein
MMQAPQIEAAYRNSLLVETSGILAAPHKADDMLWNSARLQPTGDLYQHGLGTADA